MRQIKHHNPTITRAPAKRVYHSTEAEKVANAAPSRGYRKSAGKGAAARAISRGARTARNEQYPGAYTITAATITAKMKPDSKDCKLLLPYWFVLPNRGINYNERRTLSLGRPLLPLEMSSCSAGRVQGSLKGATDIEGFKNRWRGLLFAAIVFR